MILAPGVFIAGVVIFLIVIWDAFEAIILPRRVTRKSACALLLPVHLDHLENIRATHSFQKRGAASGTASAVKAGAYLRTDQYGRTGVLSGELV